MTRRPENDRPDEMNAARQLTTFIDGFYLKPFRAMMPRRMFRYLACGGINCAASTLCFWVVFNLLLGQRHLHPGQFVIASHTFALGIAWLTSALLGFWLQKNVSFQGSPLRGRTQLFRYFLNAVATLFITWLLEKLFVEVCHIFPTVAFMMIYLITALGGFVVQKHFTFRGAESEPERKSNEDE